MAGQIAPVLMRLAPGVSQLGSTRLVAQTNFGGVLPPGRSRVRAIQVDVMDEARIRDSFAAQGMMQTLGATMDSVETGRVVIAAPIRRETGQQQGFAHAGLAFSIGDSAAGYAALTLFDASHDVVTSEMKIHLLAPAIGSKLIAEGRVVRPGKRLVVVASEVWADRDGERKHCATLLGTMVPVRI